MDQEALRMQFTWELVMHVAQAITILPLVAAAVVAACDHIWRPKDLDRPEGFPGPDALTAKR
jgi:hypothetical protein